MADRKRHVRPRRHRVISLGPRPRRMKRTPPLGTSAKVCGADLEGSRPGGSVSRLRCGPAFQKTTTPPDLRATLFAPRARLSS